MKSKRVKFDLPFPLENLSEHTQINNTAVTDVSNKSLGLVVWESVWYSTLNSFSLSLVPL